MCGNQKVCIESKGHLPKDLKTDLIITITETETNWFHQISNISKNRNNFIFSMPAYPYRRTTPAKVIIRFQHKHDIICESTYLYTLKLDGMIYFEFFFIFILFRLQKNCLRLFRHRHRQKFEVQNVQDNNCFSQRKAKFLLIKKKRAGITV